MKLIYILFTLIFFIVSCKTSPALNIDTANTQDVNKKIVQTITIQDFDKDQIKSDIEKFSKIIQSKKKLSPSDFELYDSLFETYKRLKYRPIQNKVTIPARTKLVIPLKSYCLDSNKASPDSTEPFKWSKVTNDILYLTELVKLSAENKYNQTLIQEIIWNLKNKTYWENYPDSHKEILKLIDVNAPKKIPSEQEAEAISTIKDEVIKVLPTEVQDKITYVRGQFHNFETIKSQLDVRKSNQKYPLSDITAFDDISSLYTSNKSDNFSKQEVTFYNTSEKPIEVNLTEYEQVPVRSDVQKLAAYFADDPHAAQILKQLEKLLYSDMARYGYGFIPVLNDLVDLYEVTSGKNFFTNDTLSTQDRFLSALALLLGNAEAYRQASKIFNGPQIYIDDVFKKYRNIKNEKSYKTLEKLADKLKDEGLPDSWGVKVSKAGKNSDQGLVYTHPNSSSTDIRVMPGNPNSPHKNSQKPYVKVKKDGKPLDKTGSVLEDDKSEAAHIPLNEFDFNVFREILK